MTAKTCERICGWCGRPVCRRNRKYCSAACREFARGAKATDPTPEQIRARCRLIREEGGEEWERSRSCYPPEPVSVPEARVSLPGARGGATDTWQF